MTTDDAGQLRPILWFFLLTYAVTWTLLLPVLLSGDELTLLAAGGYLLGAFGPTIGALIVTYRDAGQQGIRALLERVTVWRVPLRWWMVALCLPVVLKVGTLTVMVAAGYPVPTVDLSPLPLVVATMVIGGLVPGAIGEELGWRGYALPRRMPAMGCSSRACCWV